MKHKLKSYFNIVQVASILAAILLILGSSCKKFIEVPPAPNLIVNTQVFADSADANAAVIAMYLTILGNSSSLGPYNGAQTIYSGLYSDELYSTRNQVDENAIYANNILSTNGSIGGIWSSSFALIYKANAIIGGLSAGNTLSVASKNQFIGEAKVVRAFCYFNMVNMFGAVPLVTTTDYKISSTLPRTSPDSIYSLIISDLKDAQGLLSSNYPTDGRVRPNSYTASALLAKVYLYRGRWADAINTSSLIIDNASTYSLEPNLNNVFLAGSQEAIWQLIPPQVGYETAEGFWFVPTSATVKPKYVIGNYLLNSFEANDLRKSSWLKFNKVGGQSYYYPYKYKLGRDNNTTPLENQMVFRTAEQYLIRAEASAQQGNLDKAATDLNIIRNRAGLGNTTATNQEDLLTAIYHENQIEFFCEQSHRWYDLKRTNTADSVMNVVAPTKGGTWNSNKQLFPISSSELLANQLLVQNPGYN